MKNTPNPADDLTLHKNIAFAGIEAYKQVRASLSFLITEDDSKKCRVIGVTSSIRGEGKSTTAINLSYVLAESGQRVLLIDADMRLPSVSKKLGIKSEDGLSNILSKSELNNVSVIKTTVNEKWHVLTSGDVPPNPSELLRSSHFKQLLDVLSKSFDYCIVDLPPVNIVSDAIDALPSVDGLVLVVREGYTNRDDLAECMRKLQTVDANLFGIIANDVDNHENGKHYYKNKKYGKYYKYYQ